MINMILNYSRDDSSTIFINSFSKRQYNLTLENVIQKPRFGSTSSVVNSQPISTYGAKSKFAQGLNLPSHCLGFILGLQNFSIKQFIFIFSCLVSL